MGGTPFRVGYFERAMHQAFLDDMAAAPGVELLRLTLAEPEDRIAAQLATCHGYYARASRDELPLPWHVTPAFLARMPRLVLVSSSGAGYDTIDVEACTAAGVLVTNQAGGNAEGVAEHAVGMMLALLKRMPEAGAAMRDGAVGRREALMGRELQGRTVGLIGLGHVGRRVAEILRLAFGCRVIACDPYVADDAFAAAGVRRAGLEELLAASDIVSVHCPLSRETRGMLDAAALARLPRGAILVTTARGHIHDEAALLAALESGQVAGAGLDVWAQEPPPKDHPLLAHPAVIVTPHTAGVTHESRERVARMAAAGFIAMADGRMPDRVLNPDAAKRAMDRLRRALGARAA